MECEDIYQYFIYIHIYINLFVYVFKICHGQENGRKEV